MAVAAMRQAYGNKEYPLRGPRPLFAYVYYEKLKPTRNLGVRITFTDGTFKYNPVEDSGFYVCLLESDFVCDETDGAWLLVDIKPI